jgi:hypothetical protein
MPFLLSRGGRNIPAEVQRWQYFLLKHDFKQVGAIDGRFGAKCELATKYFQTQQGIKVTGSLDGTTLNAAQKLGYTVLPNDYYKVRAGTDWPDKPQGVKSPSNKWRNDTFHCFEFTQLARKYRDSKESIVLGGSCDGKVKDWTKEYIEEISIPQLRFAKAYPGYVLCHKLASDYFRALFEAWEQADLLHLILYYDGCFVPRYKRHQAPGDAAQPARKSSDVDQLSNHSFGSAMDMNFVQNQFPATPALCGEVGSTRELVEAAAKLGFYWGGFFLDGNHFELAHL